MVTQGQYLERPILIPVSIGALEGLWHRGKKAPAVLVLPPTPFDGASMEHPLVAELSWAAVREGSASLRFNYRGVGASQGKRDEATCLDDALAALEQLRENVADSRCVIVSIGHSAAVALKLSKEQPAPSSLFLISPRGISAADIADCNVNVSLMFASSETNPSTAQLAASAVESGGRVEVVPDADVWFTFHLAAVTRALAAWISTLR